MGSIGTNDISQLISTPGFITGNIPPSPLLLLPLTSPPPSPFIRSFLPFSIWFGWSHCLEAVEQVGVGAKPAGEGGVNTVQN